MLLSETQSWFAMTHAPLNLSNDQAFDLLKKNLFVDAPETRDQSRHTCGFTGGDHQEDRTLTREKNTMADSLFVGFRVDTNKPSASEIKAVRAKYMPTGAFPDKDAVREAKATAAAEITELVKAGKFRATSLGEILWQPREGLLLVSGLSGEGLSSVCAFIRQAGADACSPFTPGYIAAIDHPQSLDFKPDGLAKAWIENQGYETWLTDGHDCQDWMGIEFLYWLLTYSGMLTLPRADGLDDLVSATPQSVLDMRCPAGLLGKASFRTSLGNPMQLRDALTAFLQGKFPTKAGLMLSDGQCAWTFSLSGLDFKVSQCRVVDAQFDEIESEQDKRELLAHTALSLQALLLRVYRHWLKTVRMDKEAWYDHRQGTAVKLIRFLGPGQS